MFDCYKYFEICQSQRRPHVVFKNINGGKNGGFVAFSSKKSWVMVILLQNFRSEIFIKVQDYSFIRGLYSGKINQFVIPAHLLG